MTEQVILVLSSCPDAATAQTIAQALVSDGLAACVNQVDGLRSTYIWKGELRDDTEVLLIAKTTAARLDELQSRLEALHPYQLPELLTIPVAGGNERYLDWVRKGVAK